MTETQSKKVSILLSDLHGFTGIFDHHQPEAVIEMLNRYFAQMNEIISQYEGIIDKYMGDSILAIFGLHEPREDDLLRAIACATEMQLAMDDVNRINDEFDMPHLHMGIGINTGRVTAGLLGSDLHTEFTVIGHEVNLVSRIEAQTLRGQILISEPAYEEVKHYIEVSEPVEIRIKERQQPIRLYELLSTQWPFPMGVPRREVRQSPRVELDVPFQFQVVEGNEAAPKLYQGRIKDMSYKGIFALIPQLDPVPSHIRLYLTQSIFSGEARPVLGTIQAAREMGGMIGCGVEFTSMDPESQEIIKTYIDRILGARRT